MKTIVYEIRAGRYECASFCDSGGDKIKFVFEIPLNARIAIGTKIYSLKDGTATINISDISDGEVHPTLYTDRGPEKLEGFIVKSGAVIPLGPDKDYLRRLGGICEELNRRLSALEKETESINKKISQPLEF